MNFIVILTRIEALLRSNTLTTLLGHDWETVDSYHGIKLNK